MNSDDIEIRSGDLDLALIFPPLTEAARFPYLSGPSLVAYARQFDAKVRLHDFNLELHRELCNPKYFGDDSNPSGREDIKTSYHRVLRNFFHDNADDIAASAFGKDSSKWSIGAAIRMAHLACEFLVSGSMVSQRITSFKQLDAVLLAHAASSHHTDVAAGVLEEFVAQMMAQRPKAVGITVTFFSQIIPALLILKLVKQVNPNTVTVLGGQQVMLRQNDFLESEAAQLWVDGLCAEQGQPAVRDLVSYVRGELPQQDVANVVWTKSPSRAPRAESVPFATLPPPDFDDLIVNSYLSSETHLAITTCVGCNWGKCVFCAYGNRSRKNKSYDQGTPEQLADHLEYLHKRHGIGRINLVDENTNLRLVMKTMRVLNSRGVRVEFSTRNRLERMLCDKEFCQELSDRGCVMISVGFETISQRLLDKMNKGVRAADYQTIIDNLDEVGITLVCSVMSGLFDETPEEVGESVEFLKRNQDKIAIDVVQMLVCEPNTYMADDPEAFNLDVNSDGELRGNPRFSYGMGRMGAKYEFTDGLGWEERSESLASLHNSVIPGKNVDVPPRLVKVGRPSCVSGQSSQVKLKLNPATAMFSYKDADGAARRCITQIDWEEFFPLPTGLENDLTHDPNNHELISKSRRAARYLEKLDAAGCGTLEVVNGGGQIHGVARQKKNLEKVSSS